MTDSLVEQCLKNLSRAGLRVTKQRRAMLEALAQSDKPLSAEETHSELPDSSCVLVTVYRSLDQFERIGVVQLGVRENGRKYIVCHTGMIITTILPAGYGGPNRSIFVWVMSLLKLVNPMVLQTLPM